MLKMPTFNLRLLNSLKKGLDGTGQAAPGSIRAHGETTGWGASESFTILLLTQRTPGYSDAGRARDDARDVEVACIIIRVWLPSPSSDPAPVSGSI